MSVKLLGHLIKHTSVFALPFLQGFPKSTHLLFAAHAVPAFCLQCFVCLFDPLPSPLSPLPSTTSIPPSVWTWTFLIRLFHETFPFPNIKGMITAALCLFLVHSLEAFFPIKQPSFPVWLAFDTILWTSLKPKQFKPNGKVWDAKMLSDLRPLSCARGKELPLKFDSEALPWSKKEVKEF